MPFLHIRGNQCALLFTTRETAVAVALAPTESAIYNVPVLSIDNAVELLRFLAPSVVMEFETECRALMVDLECLPLAIHVAGRTLNVEAKLGWTVKDLLSELRSGSAIIQSTAPADRADVETLTIPTVAALFRQSTDRLNPICRKRFAYLGPFAPKPAAFDLDALKAVWRTDEGHLHSQLS